MLSSLRQAFLLPFRTAQIFSQEKFFARNPVIGNRGIDKHGLHTARIAAAYRLSQARRRRLARLIREDDRRRLDRDGFIVKRDFPPADIVAALAATVRDQRAPARERVAGDTVTRRSALDPRVLDRERRMAIAAPANPLVVADTFGFHARGPSGQPTTRVEIRAMGRCNPFLPRTGPDPWSLPALGLRKPILYWKSVVLPVRLGPGRQRWQPRGPVSAFDRA